MKMPGLVRSSPPFHNINPEMPKKTSTYRSDVFSERCRANFGFYRIFMQKKSTLAHDAGHGWWQPRRHPVPALRRSGGPQKPRDAKKKRLHIEATFFPKGAAPISGF
jgi:hypothetical protein